jgi:hypothetical protein
MSAFGGKADIAFSQRQAACGESSTLIWWTVSQGAVRLHLPAVYSYRFFVTSGGLASYSIDGKPGRWKWLVTGSTGLGRIHADAGAATRLARRHLWRGER